MVLDDDDIGCNPSDNPELTTILSVSRRRVLQGTLGAAAVAFLGGTKALLAQAASRAGLRLRAGVAGGPGPASGWLHAPDRPRVGRPHLERAGLGSRQRPTTAAEQAVQAGHAPRRAPLLPAAPGIEQLEPRAAGRQPRVHGRGPAAPGRPRPADARQGAKSQAAHGVSIVEISLSGDRWDVVRPSSFGAAPHRLHADAPGRPRRRHIRCCAPAPTPPAPRCRARSTTAPWDTRPGAPT